MRFMERSRRAALLTCAVWACGAAVGVRADEASVAEQTVDALNKVWGKHPGFRANHAKVSWPRAALSHPNRPRG
jgi:catalase